MNIYDCADISVNRDMVENTSTPADNGNIQEVRDRSLFNNINNVIHHADAPLPMTDDEASHATISDDDTRQPLESRIAEIIGPNPHITQISNSIPVGIAAVVTSSPGEGEISDNEKAAKSITPNQCAEDKSPSKNTSDQTNRNNNHNHNQCVNGKSPSTTVKNPHAEGKSPSTNTSDHTIKITIITIIRA